MNFLGKCLVDYTTKCSSRSRRPKSNHRRLILCLLSLFLFGFGKNVLAVEVADYPVLQSLVEKMVSEDGYPRSELVAVLGKAQIDQKTLELMDRQYESLPWHKYRKLFINERRITDGLKFWAQHEVTLQKVYHKYGVPPEVIVALLGVETHYGTRIGDKRVLDSLVTLSAAFPRRSKFFTKELRTFLNTARNEAIPTDQVLGSFAGAIGIPQFMPSSYEAYSVDFNGNGTRDLVNEYEDAMGSVANYLHVHGWNRGQAIYASVTKPLPQSGVSFIRKRAKPKHSAAELRQAGVVFDSANASEKMALLGLTDVTKKRYIVGFRNLYAITRYNPSVNYAMAITELSEAIKKLHQK